MDGEADGQPQSDPAKWGRPHDRCNAADDEREQWPMGDNRPVNQQVGLLVDVGEPVTDGKTQYESDEPDNNQ